MIIELLCLPLRLLINGIISLLPVFDTLTDTAIGIFDMLSTALQFFPTDVWILSLGSIVFWLTTRIIMAIAFFVLDIIVGIIP